MQVEDEEFGRHIPMKTTKMEYLNVEVKRESYEKTPKLSINGNPRLKNISEMVRGSKKLNHEVKQRTPQKIQGSTDEEDSVELEVDEQIAFASNYKSNRVSENFEDLKMKKSQVKSQVKSQGKKTGKKKQQKKNKNMVKQVPNFFKEDTTKNGDEQELEIESAYTELARKLFVEQLEGKGPKDLYNLMTNELKLKSVIEK